MGEVTFKLERDNRPLIEHFDRESMKEKFFYRQYAMAIRCIARYLDEEKNAPKESEFESYTDGNNNLFAFVGDRGTGKTSCMLSVANSLIHKDTNAFDQDIIRQTEFFTIGLLDPSYFDSEHDILMLFVAKLYSLFNEKAKKVNPEEDDYAQKMQLLKDFSATQKHIHSLLCGADKVEGDEFEKLTTYAVALDLKRDIYRLIDNYRKFIGMPNAILLLMVDDIDLNTNEASRMAELLRKYFVHPHTVVLISVKLDQLSYIKKQDLTIEFNDILNKGVEAQEIDEMAERYLSKFMPQEHRIFLPTPEMYFDDALTIEVGGKQRKFCSVKQAIPELIYQKTRYLFYNFDGEPSYIIPQNLRDLRQLLKVLSEMEGDLDVFESELDEKVKARNRKIFQNYLYEDWMVNNLDNETVRQVKHILASDGPSQLNNAILQVVKEKYLYGIDYSDNTEINSIKSDDNQSYNISLGDIIGLLNNWSTKKVGTDDKKFFFIIYTILSMKLYEYQQTSSQHQQEEKKEVAPQRYKDDNSDYFKLIGGRLINSNLMELLPRKNKRDSLSRSSRVIDSKAVESLIDTVRAAEQKDYRALELLMLCTFRTTSSRQDNFRSHNRVVYTDFLGNSDFVFEIGALFNNILDKDNCYQRFANLGGKYRTVVEEIKAAEEGQNTLYRLLTNDVCKHMSFRSMDLVQYFISYIANVHYVSIDDPFTVVCNFLKKVAEFDFTTYKPKEENNITSDKTVVKFDCMNAVFNFSDNETLKGQFNSLFGDEMNHETTESGTAQNTEDEPVPVRAGDVVAVVADVAPQQANNNAITNESAIAEPEPAHQPTEG